MIETILAEFARFPVPMRLSLLLLAFGGTLDILYHVMPGLWKGLLAPYLGPDATVAHILIVIGMVMTALSVVIAGSPESRGT